MSTRISFSYLLTFTGIDFYIAVLKEKIENGGQNTIKIHKNIEVVNEDGDHVFRLPEEILNPDTGAETSKLVVVADPDNEEHLLVKLKNPEEIAAEDKHQDLDKCTDLKRYFNYRKGRKNCNHTPHR